MLKAKERKANIIKNAQKFNLKINFWAGTDGSKLQLYPPKWETQNGNTGCNFSHYRLWLHLLTLKENDFIIIEDDVEILNNLNQVVLNPKFDLMWLNNRQSKEHTGCGTDGYCVNRKGLLKLIQIFEDANVPIDLRIISHCIDDPKYFQYKSKMFPNLKINATKSKIDYVKHPEINFSYINNKIMKQ